MDKLRQDTDNAEDARYREARAARDLGVDPERLRNMAHGITTEGSRMHEETRRQAQTMMLPKNAGRSCLSTCILKTKRPLEFF